ncbi:UNVERIFIED_CONTAM: hypothetical protein RMT77_000377 [Armadillidium vulgare]
MSISCSKKCFDPLKIHKIPVLTDLVKTTKYLFKKYDIFVEEHSSLFICMNCLRSLATQKKIDNQNVGKEFNCKPVNKSEGASFSTKVTDNTSTKESSIRVLVNKSTQCKLNLSSSIGTQCFFKVPDTPRVIELRKELRKKQYEIRRLRKRNSILSNLNNFSSMIEFKRELKRKTCLINHLRNKNRILKWRIKIISNLRLKVSKKHSFENCNEQ